MTTSNKELDNQQLLAEARSRARIAGHTAWYKALDTDINCTPEQAMKASEAAERNTLFRLTKEIIDKDKEQLSFPDCKVRNLDTGELKIMPREYAKKLQTDTLATHDWFGTNGYQKLDWICNFANYGTYTYKRKKHITIKQTSNQDKESIIHRAATNSVYLDQAKKAYLFDDNVNNQTHAELAYEYGYVKAKEETAKEQELLINQGRKGIP